MKKIGFTLTELLVVIIILGIVAGFALPQYQKMVERNYEKIAVRNLKAIHAMEKVYMAEHGHYWPKATGGFGSITYPDCLSELNANLRLNISEEGFPVFSCQGTDGTTFWVRAHRGGLSGPYKIDLDESPLGTSNPCCGSGTCPTLPNC